MKKIKKISKFLFLTSILMLNLPACDYLELEPPSDQLAASSLFNEKSAIDAAITGLHLNSLTMMDGSIAGVDVQRTFALLSDATYRDPVGWPGVYLDLAHGEITVQSMLSLNGIWNKIYKSIYLANLIIENIPLPTTVYLTETEKNEYLASAYYVRSFCYFNLMQLFGDVPFVTTTTDAEIGSMARTSVADLYSGIIDDLKKASDGLPETKTDVRVINSKYQVEALLARIYLQNKNYTEASASASRVIESGLYPLNVDLTNTFGRLFSTETIMATSTGENNYTNRTLFGGLCIPFYPGFAVDSPNEVVLSLFDRTNDLRFLNWYKLHPGRTEVSYNKYIWGLSTGDQSSGPVENPQDFVMCRSAEMYLIRAEARAQTNNLSGAADDINVIRNRAGLINTLATTQADLMTAVENERLMELEGEGAGFRWMDLHRWGKTNAVMLAAPYKSIGWKSHNVLMPIPNEQRGLNANLTQNDGY